MNKVMHRDWAIVSQNDIVENWVHKRCTTITAQEQRETDTGPKDFEYVSVNEPH